MHRSIHEYDQLIILPVRRVSIIVKTCMNANQLISTVYLAAVIPGHAKQYNIKHCCSSSWNFLHLKIPPWLNINLNLINRIAHLIYLRSLIRLQNTYDFLRTFNYKNKISSNLDSCRIDELMCSLVTGSHYISI